MNLDLETIKQVLCNDNYPEEYLDDWAQWLFENWNNEHLQLRHFVFPNLTRRLRQQGWKCANF
jgi:hypothetical protein